MHVVVRTYLYHQDTFINVWIHLAKYNWFSTEKPFMSIPTLSALYLIDTMWLKSKWHMWLQIPYFVLSADHWIERHISQHIVRSKCILLYWAKVSRFWFFQNNLRQRVLAVDSPSAFLLDKYPVSHQRDHQSNAKMLPYNTPTFTLHRPSQHGHHALFDYNRWTASTSISVLSLQPLKCGSETAKASSIGVWPSSSQPPLVPQTALFQPTY